MTNNQQLYTGDDAQHPVGASEWHKQQLQNPSSPLAYDRAMAHNVMLREAGNALTNSLYEFSEGAEYSAEAVDNFEAALNATEADAEAVGNTILGSK